MNEEWIPIPAEPMFTKSELREAMKFGLENLNGHYLDNDTRIDQYINSIK